MSDPINTDPAAPAADPADLPATRRRKKPGVTVVCTVETLPWARAADADGNFDHRQIQYQETVRLHAEDAPVLIANKQVVSTGTED